MGQVVVQEVTFAEYQAASMKDHTGSPSEILMRLFERKGIVMRGERPAPPADVETDQVKQVFRIRQVQ